MTPHAGQEIHGPDGLVLRILTLSEELLEMEASYPGTDVVPPAHLHPRQDERFEVLEGRLRAVVDGSERFHDAGDVFEIPAGTVHQMASEGPARVRWEVRPALRTAEFFSRLYEGDIGPGFLVEFGEEIRLVSMP